MRNGDKRWSKVGFLGTLLANRQPYRAIIEFAQKHFERHGDFLRLFPAAESINLALGACYANPLSSASVPYRNCGYF